MARRTESVAVAAFAPSHSDRAVAAVAAGETALERLSSPPDQGRHIPERTAVDRFAVRRPDHTDDHAHIDNRSRRLVTKPEEFLRAAAAILPAVPSGGDVSAVEILEDPPRRIITISTRTPGLLIGRQGTTADALRRALVQHYDDPKVQLNVREVRPPANPDIA
jgi:hypothetical protein